MAWYLCLVHMNKYATGAWPYAVIDDVTRHGGAPLRCAFFAVLAAIFVGLGLVAVALVRTSHGP